MPKTISLVAPFYNESAGIQPFQDAISALAKQLPDYVFEIVCVDDGSSDDTLVQLAAIAESDPRYVVVELSTNFGKEPALTAGLRLATGDAVVPLDADLQDPPELILEMVRRWENGAEVVLARRNDRSSDSTAKRATAEWFYRVHNAFSRTKIPENVGDFRLMDRIVVDAVNQLPERQRFMKGLFAWVGFKTEIIDYVRPSRSVGASKFSGWRLWNLALESLTGFSTAPLRIWTYVGVIGTFFSIFFAMSIIVRVLLFGVDTPGYASLMVAVVFFGSMQLLTIGIVGEYIGRIYIETKQRPNYLVRRVYRSAARMPPRLEKTREASMSKKGRPRPVKYPIPTIDDGGR